MPYYRYTIDGEETPWPGKLPEGVSSGPSAAPSNPQLTSADIQALQDSGQQSLLNNIQAAYSYANEPMQAVQSVFSSPPDLNPTINISVSQAKPEIAPPPYGYWGDIVTANIPSGYAIEFGGLPQPEWYLAEVPSILQLQQFVKYIPDPLDPQKPNIVPNFAYSGTQQPTPSVPGTTIVDTGTPTGTMPFPAIPDVIGTTTTAVQQAIGQPLQAAQQAVGQLQGQVQGQIDYQLAQAALPLPRMQQRIDANIVNTMGEVYQASYPIGLGIPTPEQIISGEPVYSPYGIGADIPFETPTPTPTPTTGGGYPPPTTPPGVTCPAPVVQCPSPPDITFSPNIVVNIPQQDGTNVTVNVDVPEYQPPEEPYEPEEEEEEEEEVEVDIDVEAPTPSPTPSPTPTPEPTPTPPEKPPEKPPKTPNYRGLDSSKFPPILGTWGDTGGCNVGGSGGGGGGQTLGQLFGYTTPGRLPSWINAIAQIDFIGPTIANIVNEITVNTVNLLNQATGYMGAGAIGAGAGAIITQISAGIITKYVGFDMTYFTRSSIYDLNFLNPQTIPSEAEFVNLFLADEISQDGFNCMVRANGSYPSWYNRIAQAQRTRPTNDQLIQLNRRGILTNEDTNDRMRGNGVMNDGERNLLYKATEAMPSVSDIVRFMVRDADDDTVAGKYGTDAQLDKKYGKQLQSWAKGQGITDEVMKYYWRSHWEIPSNTALFEMLHRLRPARTGQGLTGGVTVSPSDIKDALVVNDVLPYWADRLIEISYKPLTRTDAQRAYFIDALSENELKDAYLDLGYNDGNADRLVRFTNQLKAKRKQTTGGTEKATSILKYYKNWLIGDTEARQRLKNSGLSEIAANEALQIAGNQRKNDSQLACIKGIKAQYKRFIIDDVEARRDLTSIGVAIENITPLVAQWNCERANKPKELTAAQVCKAYKQELITETEYLRRLKAIGYGEDESGILFELCTRPPAPKTTKAGAPITPKTQTEKDAQTASARAVTQAALDALATGN